MASGTEKIKVLLVEDHAVVRAGLKMLVNSEPDMEVAGEAEDGSEVTALVRQLKPGIIMMDVSMPKLNGLQACKEIMTANPGARVLMLTMHADEEYFFQALRNGALGYVPKSAPDKEVLDAIRTVARGEIYIHSSLAHLLVHQFLGQEGEKPRTEETLSERELEVLRLVAMGYANKEIAEQLCISIHTVHNHRNNIMEKLNIHDRLGLFKFALKKGLLNLE